MSSPQLENGSVKIANELFDALITFRLGGYERSVLDFIIRKTYGWNKKTDWISLSQFVDGTKIKQTHVCRAISQLIKQNIIIKTSIKDRQNYGVQKNYSLWKKPPKNSNCHYQRGDVPNMVISITKFGNQHYQKGDIQNTLLQNTLLQSVADATDTVKIGQEKFTMKELEEPTYHSEHLPKKKSRHGSQTMAQLVRAYADITDVEIKGTFDGGPWATSLSIIYQYFDKDFDSSVAYMKRAVDFYKSIGRSFSITTIQNIPDIERLIREDKDKKEEKFNSSIYD